MSYLDFNDRGPLGALESGERYVIGLPVPAGTPWPEAARLAHQVSLGLVRWFNDQLDIGDTRIHRERDEPTTIRVYSGPIGQPRHRSRPAPAVNTDRSTDPQPPRPANRPHSPDPAPRGHGQDTPPDTPETGRAAPAQPVRPTRRTHRSPRPGSRAGSGSGSGSDATPNPASMAPEVEPAHRNPGADPAERQRPGVPPNTGKPPHDTEPPCPRRPGGAPVARERREH